jgi:hypothetical protein
MIYFLIKKNKKNFLDGKEIIQKELDLLKNIRLKDI